MGARIAAVAGLCAHLSGPRAKRIHDHFMEAGVRVEAGDPSLHSVIGQNREKVDRAAADGDVLAVALQGTRHEHEEVGIDSCREQHVNAPNIQNMLNQVKI